MREVKKKREKEGEMDIRKERKRLKVTLLFLQVWVALVSYLILFQTIHPLLLLTRIILLALNYKKIINNTQHMNTHTDTHVINDTKVVHAYMYNNNNTCPL